MKGKREEAEVIIRIDQEAESVEVCVCSWPAMFRKMNKLYGPSMDGMHPGQSARWKLPMKTVSFRRIAAVGKRTRMPTSGFKRMNKLQSGDERGWDA